jgi:hypothetical protein
VHICLCEVRARNGVVKARTMPINQVRGLCKSFGHRIDKYDAGAYFGLIPGSNQSGDQDPQMPITKTGNEDMRRLLVGSAQFLMVPALIVYAFLQRQLTRGITLGALKGWLRALHPPNPPSRGE